MLKISHAFGLAAIIAAATASIALAQPREQPAQTGQAPGGADPHGHSETTKPSGETRSGSGGAQQNMTGQGMMGQGMMGAGAQRQSGGSSMPMMNMGMGAGAMGMGRAAGMGMPMGRLPMMKMMFAITDADGNGAVSFNEVVEIHKRMFDAVDADNDGGVTPEEIESFFRN